MLVLAKPILVARLLASDFPSENPRTQTRNFPYTTRCNTSDENDKNTVYIDERKTDPVPNGISILRWKPFSDFGNFLSDLQDC